MKNIHKFLCFTKKYLLDLKGLVGRILFYFFKANFKCEIESSDMYFLKIDYKNPIWFITVWDWGPNLILLLEEKIALK